MIVVGGFFVKHVGSGMAAFEWSTICPIDEATRWREHTNYAKDNAYGRERERERELVPLFPLNRMNKGFETVEKSACCAVMKHSYINVYHYNEQSVAHVPNHYSLNEMF